MKHLLPIICFAAALIIAVLDFPNSAVAVMLTAVSSLVIIFAIRYFFPEESEFLTNLFLVALLARLLFGTLLHVYDWRNFFGGDADTYDVYGNWLMEIWFGLDNDTAIKTNNSGWGMPYLVAAIYSVVGRNIFAAQCFCGVIGAATAPLVYNCAYQIFGNRRVGKISALLVALYPAFIIWSGQLLKDGLIVFLLVLTITMILQLQKKFSYQAVIVIVLALFGILSLRFYIFYMVGVAAVGSFVIGLSSSTQSIIKKLIILVLIGFGLTYLGVLRNAEKDIDQYTNLERIQQSRADLARASSGFGQDIDVSTTEGAISAIPIGFVYLMFAPFPWQMNSLSQLMTLPDMLIWWGMMIFLVRGLIYSIKHRLRNSIAVLMFSLMLTIGYCIFQGNVGMAYRQRTQIQVFLFMFGAVGWTLLQENKENKKAVMLAKNRERAGKNSIRASV
jgi:Dolichyl-phosphate-mannose-protein mannosyltransferase